MSGTEHVPCSICGADVEVTKEEAKLFGPTAFICNGCGTPEGGVA